MSISTPILEQEPAEPIPHRPSTGSGRAVYDNMLGVLNEEVIEALANNQGMFATHQSLVFKGYVYAYTDEKGDTRWCEEVWIDMEMAGRYRARDLDALINHATDIYGDV